MLSQHFSLDELIATSTIYRNIPSHEQLLCLENLCKNVLEPAREKLDNNILVSSAYRSPEVNAAVRGAKNSQHVQGKAADLQCHDNRELFEIIKSLGNYDQLIWEFGTNESPSWVHVSYNEGKNRKQVLRAYKIAGMTIYKKI